MIRNEVSKFDSAKIQRQLRKINKENNQPVDTGIQIIINNIIIYNNLVDKINYSEIKTLYLIFQMSSTIFNELKNFNIYPQKKTAKEKNDELKKIEKEKEEKEDTFLMMKARIEHRNT